MSRRDEDPVDPKPQEGGPEDPSPPANEASPLFLEFSVGNPDTVAAMNHLVGRVVRTRGYYIPLDQRPDVIQEAMTDLVRTTKTSSFATDDAFLGFARMVGHRRCVDWLRLARKNARVDSGIRQLVAPDDELLSADRQRLAAEVFAELREPCRQLLALRVGRGLSYTQLAALLGRSEGALRTQCSYCLRQAREILERSRRRKRIVRLVDWRRK